MSAAIRNNDVDNGGRDDVDDDDGYLLYLFVSISHTFRTQNFNINETIEMAEQSHTHTRKITREKNAAQTADKINK